MHPLNLIREYGARFPQHFGGVYMEAATFVVLFTQDMTMHEGALRQLVTDPGQILVRHGTRSWRAVERSKHEVAQLLLDPERRLGVTTVGIGVREEQFAVMVGIDPYDEKTASEIERLVQPHAVVVRQQGPGRYI